MWILIAIFAAETVLLGWVMFGYFTFAWFVGLLRRHDEPAFPDNWPKLSIVIPCFNEQDGILAKLENIRQLRYPKDRLEVYFVDGGSSDRTVPLLMRTIRPDESCRVITAARSGKIQQVNEILPWLQGDYIVMTDADALLEPDALQWLVAEFTSDDRVGVVGAYCRPHESADWIDQYFWDANNKARFIESRWHTASIAVAPCYAFRRGLISQFPEDVVADDIYAAFISHCAGCRTVYSRKARAVEMRNPRTLTELLPHKFRKANAFLRESLRFLYRLPEMTAPVKTLFLTRVSQQLLMPWILSTWCLLALTLITSRPEPRFDIVGYAGALLLTLLLVTVRAFHSVTLPDSPRTYSLLTVVRGYLLTNFILLATGLSYPFYRQNSSYPRHSRTVIQKSHDLQSLILQAREQDSEPNTQSAEKSEELTEHYV